MKKAEYKSFSKKTAVAFAIVFMVALMLGFLLGQQINLDSSKKNTDAFDKFIECGGK